MDMQEWKKVKYVVPINTAAGEADIFSHRTQDGAALVNQKNWIMGIPYRSDFKNMLSGTLISNYPIAPDDVTMDNKIYGPNLHYLKGKTARKNSTSVIIYYIALPS